MKMFDMVFMEERIVEIVTLIELYTGMHKERWYLNILKYEGSRGRIGKSPSYYWAAINYNARLYISSLLLPSGSLSKGAKK